MQKPGFQALLIDLNQGFYTTYSLNKTHCILKSNIIVKLILLHHFMIPDRYCFDDPDFPTEHANDDGISLDEIKLRKLWTSV